jgi:alpha-1,2-mannosyltransferase
MQISGSISPPAVRRRLWKAGTLIGLFIITLVVANQFVPPRLAVTRDMLGHDFLVFYAAGTFARTGQIQNLYDLSAIRAMESATARAAGLGSGFGPWWNPPFAAWLFAPFSYLPFNAALIAWELFSLACLAISIVLLARMIGGGWRRWGLIPLLTFGSSPFWLAAGHGQNTFFTLLLLTITVTLWRKKRSLAAGLVAGLLLYKPQHAIVIGIVLILSLGRRAAAGFLVTAAGLLVITLFTMPNALADYLHKLPRTIQVMQELSDYSWDRHLTIKAFWRLLLQGTTAGATRWTTWTLWWGSELVVMGMLRRILRMSATDRQIAAAIIATPLLNPFFLDYDALILAIPAVLCVAGADRAILRAWIVVYLLMYFSNPIAVHTGFNPAVPAIVGIMAVLGRMPRIARAEISSIEAGEPPRALAA